MPENDLLSRLMDAGLAFTQMTRERAEAIVRDLVRNGELQRDQTGQSIDDLVERSRQSTQQLVELVRQEITDQLGSLGLATKDDLRELEERLQGRMATAASGPGRNSPPPRPAPTAPVPANPAEVARKAAKKASEPVKKSAAKKATGGIKKAAKKAGGAGPAGGTRI